MSECRHQALIEAPIERVWDLVGNPARYPEWFPRVVEVRGDKFDVGSIYVQSTRGLVGTNTTSLTIDQVEELRSLQFHCLDTGMYAHFALTPARADTFVEVEFGMEPNGPLYRLFDATVGRPYFRRWLVESMTALASQATILTPKP